MEGFFIKNNECQRNLEVGQRTRETANVRRERSVNNDESTATPFTAESRQLMVDC